MSTVTLRGYQNECITGTREAISKGARRVACVLPTGSGKTTIFGSICQNFARRGTGAKAVIVSHLGLLTSQTGDRFRDEWGLATEVLQADRLPTAKAQTIITTMQSFRSEEKLLRWADKLSFGTGTLERLDIGLLIIDECHLVGNESYSKILSMFPNAYVIGFTATPFRQNKLMTNMFDEVAYTISMQELIDQGYLVPPKLHLTDYDTEDLGDVASKIVQIYNTKHKGEKAVVYMRTIEEAETLRNILIECGITSSAVTSKLTGAPRDELLRDFKKGDGPSILTTVDVLTAGFDSPNLMCIFMPYRVGSVTTYLQRIGRGLRPYEGKSHCDIYVGANSPGIENGFWEKITKQVLNAGKRDYDNYEDLLEYGKNDFSHEEYVWTKEVVDMANKAKLKGMEELSQMMVTKVFPPELLDVLVEHPPAMRKSKVKATPAQIKYVSGIIGQDASRLTKQECSIIIDAHKRKNGWEPPKDEIVPAGKHKGKHFSQVPHAYWRFAAKSPSSELWKSYKQYKNKIGGKK